LKVARWAHLLEEEPDFRRWYENLSMGSKLTGKEGARMLYRFLKNHEDISTPKELVEIARRDRREVEDILQDFVTRLHGEGKSGNYIANYLKVVRSWLNFNDIQLVRKIKIPDRNRTPTIEDERVPTQEELASILRASKPRGACSVVLMAHSGLRPQVLGTSDGGDGLEIRDFPEMLVENGMVSFTVKPTMVKVRRELSKAKHRYFTFLSEEGCTYLKEYLERRMAEGETLEPRSPVIAVYRGWETAGYRINTSDNAHITRKSVTKEIRGAMRPRFEWRPYVLRAYFDTMLLIAESQGKITHAYRQFFMGHTGDMEARYTTNKGRLPESMIEDMREAYRRSQSYFQTTGANGIEDLKATFRKQLLLVAGFSPEEVEVMDPSMDDEAFQEMVRKRLLGAMANNGANQRIIGVEEVERFLSGGWDFVATLPDDRIVVRLPH
jgi:hypothetical protein